MNQTPRWFTAVAAAALLWNLLGCAAIASDLALTADQVAKMSDAEKTLYQARAPWAVAASVIAVAGGALGCLGLILRKKWALPVLAASLAGILVQDFGLFILNNAVALAGPVVAVMQGLVLAIGLGLGLVFFALKAKTRGWLG